MITRAKPTDLQLVVIRMIEKNIQLVKFTGKMFQDARRFIMKHISESMKVQQNWR